MILSKSDKKSFNPDNFRKELLEKNSLHTLLSIVPTRRRIRNLSRWFITKSSKAVDTIYIETIETLAEKLLKSSGEKFNIIKEPVAAVLLKECFEENKGSFKYFPNDKIPQGTLDKLKNLISEYKRHPISVTNLKEEIEQGLYNEGDILKVNDIVCLYEAYNIKCQQLHLKEIGDIFSALNSLPSAGFINIFSKTFPGVNTVYIEGYNQFSESELQFLNVLTEAAEVFVDFDFYDNNENLFGHIHNIKERLHTFGWQIIESGEGSSELQNYLGTNLSKRIRQKSDFTNQITVTECSTREKEVEVIAKQIKKIIKENKTEAHKIAVVFHDISNYSNIIRDKFNSSKIPFNLTDRKQLSSSIPVSAILFFLQIKMNDFYYKDIVRAFSSRFLTLIKDAGIVNSSNLLKCAASLKITGGLNNWKNTLADAISRAEERDLNRYTWALQDINAIEEALKYFEGRLSPSEFHENLLKLISKLKINDNILSLKYNIEENAKGFQKFLSVLDELLDIHFSNSGKQKYPLSHFYSMLATAVNRERFSLADRPNYGVFISTLDEARGLKFEHVFIGGLVDGVLPSPYKPELLVLRKKDEEKTSKSELQQIRERYLFYQTICSSKGMLYMSYPMKEDKRQYEKSVFLKELELIADTEFRKDEIFRGLLVSKEELLKNLGTLEIGNNIELPVKIETVKVNASIEIKRESDSESETRFTGYLLPENDLLPDIKAEDEAVTNNIKSSLETERSFSVSQFERFASCPFKYFSERLLKLTSVDEPQEEIEKTELGSLLHKIFCDFYNEYGLEKCITEKNRKAALKLIFEIAERESKNYFKTDKDFFEKEKIFGIAGEKKDSILYRFIDHEIAGFEGFVPWQLEYKFEDQLLNGVSIKGQIDRIDINREAGQFRIIDYKLGGKKPTDTDLSSGTSLQLPVYLEIARRVIKQKEKIDLLPESGIIYSLKISEDKFGMSKVIGPGEADEIIEISVRKITEYAEEIKKGRFNMSGYLKNGACTYCDFSNMCRVG